MRGLLRTITFVAALVCGISYGQAPKKNGISVGEPPADHSPEAELASFTVLEGFKVNLFASEADGVPNPLVLRWDERGRLWVISTTAYPQPAPGEPCDDKILILEDTDHDGRMDKKTVFAGGLRMPTGMELAGPGELYVGQGEKLWLFKDTNGDDRVDEKEVIFSGFGTGDTHQNINSFIWAPDGALVMHQGLHCYSSVTTPWGVKRLYGSGFWRFWPRSKKLEAYPTGMPANAWGTAFTRWGQPIMVAGAAGMFWARPMEIGVPEIQTDNPQPYLLLTRFMLPFSGQIIKKDGLRKFCGVDIPFNDHWPNQMADEVVAGGFFENAVFRYEIKPDASGFEAVEQPPLITSSNVAFRPVDVRFGPEGALYIADWYDPIIGHYQASFRHPNRDKAHGRIWRVSHNSRPLVNWQERHGNVAAESARSLIQGVADYGDLWWSYQARRLVTHRPAQDVLAAARDLWNSATHPGQPPGRYSHPGDDQPGDRPVKMTALQMFEAFEEPAGDLLKSAFLEPFAPLHIHAAHAVGTWSDRLPNTLELLGALISDEDAAVRLEAIVACAKVKHPDAIKVALKALDKPMDTFLDRALWLTVHATAPLWKRSVVSSRTRDGRSETTEPPKGGTTILSTLPPRHLAYLVEREGSAELLDVVRGMLKEKAGDLPPDTLRALTGVLVKKGGPADLLYALQLGDPGVLDELASAVSQQGGQAPAEAAGLLKPLLQNGTPAQQEAACRLTGGWKLHALAKLVEEKAGAEGDIRPPGIRIAALAALGKLGATPELAQRIAADPKEPWPVRVAALGALTSLKPGAAVAQAAQALSTIADADTMRAWLTPLLAREGTINALARALDAQPCTPEAARLALATLTAAGRGDTVLITAFTKIAGVKNTVPAYDPAWISELAAEVKSQGNAEAGKGVFSAPLSGCTACHQISKQGGTIGPELDNVGRGVPLELLIEAVVWPGRQIKEGYVSTTLTLKDGRRLQGYKISEGAGELVLRDFLSGTVSRFTSVQIQDKQEAGSLMPEGLIMNMTRAELRDLIAYLASLGGVEGASPSRLK